MKIVLVAIVVSVVAFAGGVWYDREYGTEPTPTQSQNNERPAPQATYHNADADNIVVDTPKPGAIVGNTFTVSGKARGGWYFEASFPIRVLDANGNEIFLAPVQALSNWMTTEFVPFSTQIIVPNYKGAATLVLHNDNPSGLPENNASISIPIVVQ